MAQDETTAQISGLDTVLATLQTLGDKTPKIVAKANKAGAKVVREAALARSPVRSGLMKENIRIRTSNKKKLGVYRAFVGVGAKDWTGPAFYGSFVLWGHRVGPRRLGNVRKEVPANDFLKRSAAEKGEDAANAVIDELKAGVEAAATQGAR